MALFSTVQDLLRTLVPLLLKRITEMIAEVQAVPKPQEMVTKPPVWIEHSYRLCNIFSDNY